MQDCEKELDFSRLPAAKVFFHPSAWPPFFLFVFSFPINSNSSRTQCFCIDAV